MNEDRIIEKLLEHDGRLDHINEKLVKLDTLDVIMSGQDRMIRILERVDQERVFTNEKIKHLETDLESIKLRLQIA